jgi:hypothetical protein
VKTCPSCGLVGDRDINFGRRGDNGFTNAYCRACAAARTRAYNAAHPDRPRAKADPEKARIRNRRYFKRHRDEILERQRLRDKAEPEKKRERVRRRRARLREATVETVDYAAIRAQNDHCYLCGEELGCVVDYDHIVPIASGGPHASWNVLPTHPRCNRRKAGRSVESLPWVIDSAYCIARATLDAIERRAA